MRKLLLITVSLFLTLFLYSQSNTSRVDSLTRVLARTNADTIRVQLLRARGYLERNYEILQQSIELSKEINYRRGEADGNNSLGNYFFGENNYPKAMEFYLECLKISEAINYPQGVAHGIANIGSVYLSQGEYQLALNNTLRALTITKSINNTRGMAIQSYDAARGYLNLGKTDSALFYATQSYQHALSSNDSNALTNSLLTLGDIHQKLSNTKLSLEYYRMALPFSPGYFFALPEIYMSMANLYKEAGETDSSVVYAQRALTSAQELSNGDIIFKAGNLLSIHYEKTDLPQSFYYYKLAVAGKDSMFSAAKVKQIQNLSFNEKLRQQEIAAEKHKLNAERQQNLQYAGIALGLVLLIMIFLILSHSIIANQRIIKFLGILSLLIVFEFINLFIHPYLGDFTNHSPILMLSILVVIAALLIPVHHWLEKWLTKKMVEKNKKIRLEAAKKTIAKLEQ